MPTIASQKSWPLCREKQEREAAFNVLYQLTAGIDQYNSLIALMNTFQSTISLDKIGKKINFQKKKFQKKKKKFWEHYMEEIGRIEKNENFSYCVHYTLY